MAKRALCVGINDYPGRDDDLSGCVNDAKAWATLLVEQYDFTRDDVRVVTNKRATHRAMTNGLKSLLKGARAGDVLVFAYSGHGTYLADANRDEPSYDEALCPWDADDNLLIDDELRALFADVSPRAHLTVILDSCHSGTGTRLRPGRNTIPRRPRFLPPKRLGNRSINTRTARRRTPKTSQSAMTEVLLAGCSEQQESNDADFPEASHGAFTYYALRAISDAHHRISYSTLLKNTDKALRANGFDDQTPQVEGRAANKRRQVFT